MTATSKSDMWWQAFCAALSGRTSICGEPNSKVGNFTGDAAKLAGASLEEFSERWPEQWKDMPE